MWDNWSGGGTAVGRAPSLHHRPRPSNRRLPPLPGQVSTMSLRGLLYFATSPPGFTVGTRNLRLKSAFGITNAPAGGLSRHQTPGVRVPTTHRPQTTLRLRVRAHLVTGPREAPTHTHLWRAARTPPEAGGLVPGASGLGPLYKPPSLIMASVLLTSHS